MINNMQMFHQVGFSSACHQRPSGRPGAGIHTIVCRCFGYLNLNKKFHFTKRPGIRLTACQRLSHQFKSLKTNKFRPTGRHAVSVAFTKIYLRAANPEAPCRADQPAKSRKANTKQRPCKSASKNKYKERLRSHFGFAANAPAVGLVPAFIRLFVGVSVI